MKTLRKVILFLALTSAAPVTLQAQSRYIEPSRRNACVTLGGRWSTAPIPTCTLPSLFQDRGHTLIIRRGARVIVQRQFINYGTVIVGDPDDPSSASQGSSGMLILGEAVGVGGGVNGGAIYVLPHPEGGSATLSTRLGEFVNTNIIYVQAGHAGDGGFLSNFGRIVNGGRIYNRGFLYNASSARIESRGAAFVSDQRGFGTMLNLGTITGRFLGTCTGRCLP
jgi:hypothetical protein